MWLPLLILLVTSLMSVWFKIQVEDFSCPWSLDGYPNPHWDRTDFGPRDSVIYQGHGIPLAYETRATVPVNQSAVHFHNYRFAPECCPSPYSSDRGCVCWTPPPLTVSDPPQYLRTKPT